jgi:hypothetical protein
MTYNGKNSKYRYISALKSRESGVIEKLKPHPPLADLWISKSFLTSWPLRLIIDKK